MLRPVVELKGYRDGLRLIIDPEASMDRIQLAIVDRMANLGNSLAGMGLNIDIGDRSLSDEELTHLSNLLHKNYGLDIKRVIRESDDQTPIAEDLRIIGAPALHQEEHAIDNQFSPEHEETLFLRNTLRSGQVERFLEGNIVILGDVNPGAEVTAAGDIIVLGALRGVAHAGALGNTSSVIIALNLLPTQLRIGRFITRPPAGGKRKRRQAEVARVNGESITVEEFNGL
ncbi:MAG: septum site-determining protein MinC [Candidatus Poribacteria bacterium]|nr:septum site-determining protein MinC [Candidatus Poribacteria bacterium]